MVQISNYVLIIIVSLIAFIINLPMGWWRASVRKFSLSWFLAIHLSVPLIFYIRTMVGIDSGIVPILIFLAVSGQLVGGKFAATTN